jgi:CubicO group peptidase (beta-lactamase class C family)
MPTPTTHLPGDTSPTLPDDAGPLGSVRELYDGALWPDVNVRTLRHSHRLFPTRTVRRGERARELPARAGSWPRIVYGPPEQRRDLVDYMALHRVSGLVVLKDGELAFEQHALGSDATSLWASMSMVKSISTTLVGAAIHQGLIGGVDDPVCRYLPELRGSAYDGVSLCQLLQMASGVRWNETYTDPASDRRRMLDAQVAQQPGAILRLMASLPRAAAPGTVWNYSTGETHVVGALLRAAVGRPLAEYLSERIWSRAGMEAEAHWWLESPGGLEVGGSGLSARLRDWARFGLFMLDDGVVGGERILPEGWVAEATSAKIVGGQRVAYGYMWWPVDVPVGSVHDGAFCALGIFGQCLYIHPRDRVVIAQFSAWPKPKDVFALPPEPVFGAIVEALR